MIRTMKAAGLAAALAIAAPAAALAQAAAQTSIIVVDLQRVLTDSAAGKSASSQLRPQADQVQARVRQLEDQFTKERNALQQTAQNKSVAPEALQKQAQDLQTRAQSAQLEVQNRERALNEAQNNVIRQITDQANPIISTIMRERGATVALARAATLQLAQSVDVTNEVIARLDKQLPSVRVVVPATPTQPAAQRK